MMLIVAFIMFVLAPATRACSCGVPTLYQKYCSSDYFIEAKVLSSVIPTPGPGPTSETLYTVGVLNIFKDTTYSLGSNTSIVDIWTPVSDAECGVTLDVNKTYYLGGYSFQDKVNRTENKLEIELCNFYGETKDLKSCEKEMLTNNQFDCSCKHRVCFKDC